MKKMKKKEHFLVLGARGFIGAWICRLLAEENVQVTAADASPDLRSISSVMTAEQIAKIRFVTVDARDEAEVVRLIGEDVTHVIYLAGLLRPASELNPWLSAQVSIGGLMNVFNAAILRGGDLRIAYSSTAAIYGPAANYPNHQISEDSQPMPHDHYGIHRYMMEMTAEQYFRQHGLTSIGLRPWIVYGAGRFNGLSAQPSLAMLAAAANAPFEINFSGRSVFHHVRDVALAFIRGARCDLVTAVCANIPGESVEMSDLIEIIDRAMPSGRGNIRLNGESLGLAEAVDDPTLERLIGPLPSPTSVRVKETIEDYRKLLAEGRVTFP